MRSIAGPEAPRPQPQADHKRLTARAMATWTRPSAEDLDDAAVSYLQMEQQRA